jgi:hypothetical protein
VDATSTRSREASLDAADGVVRNGTLFEERIPKHFGNPDHPVCAAAVASRRFIDGAATPAISGGDFGNTPKNGGTRTRTWSPEFR